MIEKEVIVIGGGPCGLSTAIELQERGFDVLVIEKGNIVNAIYRYPTHQTFFSSSDKLAIGNVPFITEKAKPQRNDALVYYREVVRMKNVQVHPFEEVQSIEQNGAQFFIQTSKEQYIARQVVMATGYYDQPNLMHVEGEDLPHVMHYFKEAHPYFGQHVVVIGGKNSAVDAAIELERAGAYVTVVYRGENYSASVKPWILPGFDSLVRHEKVNMHFNTKVTRITDEEVTVQQGEEVFSIPANFVFAMTGYLPDYSLLTKIGVTIDEETGRPTYNSETMESNIKNLFIAGVVAAGKNANEIFIENGRHHGEAIAETLMSRKAMMFTEQ